MPDNTLVSVAICTYNRFDLLADAIASVQSQSISEETYEILVIDNNPDASISAELSGRYRDVRNLRWRHEPKRGLSHARNRALAEAVGNLIAFMDDDARAESHWLAAALRTFKDVGERAAVVGGPVLPVWQVPRPAWLHDDLLSHLTIFDKGPERRNLDPGEWLAGTNICFRTDQLRAIGGFSEHLGRRGGESILIGNEEIEVIGRLIASGGSAVYDPLMVVSHVVPASRLTQTWFRRRVIWQAISDYLMRSGAMTTSATENWHQVTAFFAALPPTYKSPRGLFAHQGDAEMFNGQMRMLYYFTLNFLSGFEGIDEAS